MKHILTFLSVLVFGAALTVAGSRAVEAQAPVHDQTDAVDFTLWWVGANELWTDPETWPFGDVVYCGVAENAEPYELDVAVVAPPVLDRDKKGLEYLVTPGYEFAGLLGVAMQNSGPTPEAPDSWPHVYDYNVPTNGSFAFSLTLGGRPGEDQLVSIFSKPAGDGWAHGHPMSGFASVRANPDAVDPFEGDGRTDNFCLTIGLPEGYAQGGTWEFIEGEITTTLPVPDDWVLDGDGSDGGALRGFPH